MQNKVFQKMIAFLSVLLLLLSLCSCKKKKDDKKTEEKQDASSQIDTKTNGNIGGGIEGPIIDVVPVE